MIDVNPRGVLHGIAAALPLFRRQGRGHFVTTVSTAVARAIAFAIEQAHDVEIGDVTIRPTVQG